MSYIYKSAILELLHLNSEMCRQKPKEFCLDVPETVGYKSSLYLYHHRHHWSLRCLCGIQNMCKNTLIATITEINMGVTNLCGTGAESCAVDSAAGRS